jgi:hypothetical protein
LGVFIVVGQLRHSVVLCACYVEMIIKADFGKLNTEILCEEIMKSVISSLQ